MNREALRQRLMQTFLGELEEHVQSMTRDLLALETSADDDGEDRVTSLFRTAHSLKGAARSVNLPGIERACHQLESLFSSHRQSLRGDDAAIQLLYRTTDALKDASVRLRNGVAHPERSVEAVLPALAQLTRGAPQPVAETPTPSTSPVDTSASPASTPHEPTVRIGAKKLDALVMASGELLIARKRATGGRDAAAALRDDVRRWRVEWARMERPLRRLMASQPKAVPKRVGTALGGTGARLQALERRVDQLASTLASDLHRLDRAAEELDDGIRRVRMFPLNDACEGLERTVRDLAHDSGRRAKLTVHGGEIELGRLVLDALRDPLLHLVRNAMAHGIEEPAQRTASGKPETGSITIAASLRGSEVEIVVADDGRGLDLSAIREHARRQGIPPPTSDRDAARLVFLPGLTTASSITEISGRGMGLEIVKDRIRALHGRAEVMSESGRGTRVALTVPLTVLRIRALHLEAGGQVYVLPLANVVRVARVGPADLRSIGGREVLMSDGAPIPVVPLAGILHTATAAAPRSASRIPVVVVTAGTGTMALAVDALLSEEEILVKHLGERLRRVRHFAGATILPSGRVALILNAADLLASANATAPASSLTAALTPSPAARPRILVVDDSITTRSLEKSILEASGYDVMVAVDGEEGWKVIQERGVDLVVADVEMPHMNGFALCQTIRASTRFRALPVVLVTGLSSEHDKARGLAAGANAYLFKSAFDQRQLLETIARLL